jgi:hypothetical protein
MELRSCSENYGPPTGAASIEATAELLDNLPQFVRVFLDDPARFLRARQLRRRLFLTPAAVLPAASCQNNGAQAQRVC